MDEELNRSDIRTDPSDGTVKSGALLALNFNVSRAASNACSPLAGAIVDVWHCDALGLYSDVSDPGFNTAASASSAYEFTSQLFFDDTLTDQVQAQQPYAAKGQRTLRNSGDGIYNQGGSQLVLNVTQASNGYAATFDIALDKA